MTAEHREFLAAHAKDLVGPAYLELEYHDMLGILRCMHQALQVTDPAAVMILTDRELVKLYADSWGRDFDDDEPAPEERIATPRVLVIWCGELREGPKASCEMLLDTLRIRRSRGKITWLGRDPKERFWFGEQAGYADVVTFLKRQFAHIATPRLVAPPTHHAITCADSCDGWVEEPSNPSREVREHLHQLRRRHPGGLHLRLGRLEQEQVPPQLHVGP